MTKQVNLVGTFKPANTTESVAFQKEAIKLGFGWVKAGGKVIDLKEDQAIVLKEDGRMVPKTDGVGTLTLADIKKAVIDSYEGQTLTTRAKLMTIYNKTKCREIEEAIETLLQDHFGYDDNEEFPVPQELIEAGAAMTDEQKEWFAEIGISFEAKTKITHKNGVVSADVDADTLEDLKEVATGTSVGRVLVDAKGDVYFAK